MDPYAPVLMAKGLKGMIGKGSRGKEVIEAMKKYKAVYLAATCGAGALLQKDLDFHNWALRLFVRIMNFCTF
jgi:fumarate hydratase subunit beta